MIHPKIYVLYLGEDDPSKNTSLKMVRKGYALRIHPRSIRGQPLVLNPYAKKYLGPWLRNHIDKHGILVIDASWKKLSPKKTRVKGKHYKLPPLLPGNPINYAKPCILSSIEAVAAALYITGYRETYEKLLGLYKWMNTFHTLNQELLEAYSKTKNEEELLKTIQEYWGPKPPC